MKKIKFNETKYDKTVLILGVFHGDEQDGEFLIQKYIDSNPKITKNRIIFICCKEKMAEGTSWRFTHRKGCSMESV